MTLEAESTVVRVGGWPWQGCFCFLQRERRVVLQGNILLLCHLAKGEHPAVQRLHSLRHLGGVSQATPCIDPWTVQRVVPLTHTEVLSEGDTCKVVPRDGDPLHLHFRSEEAASRWCQLLTKAREDWLLQQEVLEQAASPLAAKQVFGTQVPSVEASTPVSAEMASPSKKEPPGKRGSSREDLSPRRGEQARLSDLAALRASLAAQQARLEAKSSERTSPAQAGPKVRRPLSTEGAGLSPARRAVTLRSSSAGGIQGVSSRRPGMLAVLTAPLSPRARSRKLAFQQLLSDDVLHKNRR
ncbi:unnamed protein product [Symbiodinium natans]|uniref:PH domain-containing protein n=1 Tax=Symbiodinium natans TaxID=878477 RepID=A0A812RHB4_9DINO|nr:unnamed protein product [Symbiodinium natans]